MPAHPTTTRFLFALIWPYRARLAVGIAAMLLTTACMLMIPQVLKQMFDTALQHGDREALALLAATMLSLVLVMVAGVMLRAWFIQFAVNEAITNLRLQLAKKIVTLDVAVFETRGAGDILSRMNTDTSVMRNFFIGNVPVMVRGLVLILGTTAILLVTNAGLTVVLLAAAAPMTLVGWRMGRWIKNYSRTQQDNLGILGNYTEESVSYSRTIKAFGQEGFMFERLKGIALTILGLGNKKALVGAALVSSNLFIGFVALIGVVWLGGNQVIDGTLTLGQMMAFLFYLAFLADGASSISEFWPSLQNTLGATERVREFLQQRRHIRPPQNPKPLPKRGTKARAVAFESVSFAYASRPQAAAVENVSFKVKAGEKVAIVGPSGAGKTTLFSLLLRFYDVQHGHIRVDGVDIRELAFSDLRGAIAAVAQEPAVFSATVRDNVAYGRPQANEAEVWHALQMAHADDFVKALPHGLNTPVGEKGVQLSGGQRQRLALARAVLVDAPILLLDEATSHLDAESEHAVQAALEAAGEGRTVVTIAHRLSTVKAADKIIVLEQGRVAATGTHAELMKKSRLYKALAHLQMLG